MAIYLYPAAEDHDYSCGIFQDFSKVFDAVTHKILLTSLNTLLSEIFLKTGLAHIWATELKRYHLVPLFLKCKEYFVGCLKDQYWGHSFSLFI